MLSFIFMASCQYGKPDMDYITIHSLAPRINHNNVYFYTVGIDVFEKAMNSPGYMVYVGSIKDYHLFYKRYKILPKDGVHTFALPNNLCLISKPKSPEEEERIRTPNSFRRAEIINGKCVLVQVN